MTETVNTSMQQKYGRVGVLYGGASAERDISLLSGDSVIRSLRRSGVDVVPIDVSDDLLQRLPEHQLDRALRPVHISAALMYLLFLSCSLALLYPPVTQASYPPEFSLICQHCPLPE